MSVMYVYECAQVGKRLATECLASPIQTVLFHLCFLHEFSEGGVWWCYTWLSRVRKIEREKEFLKMLKFVFNFKLEQCLQVSNPGSGGHHFVHCFCIYVFVYVWLFVCMCGCVRISSMFDKCARACGLLFVMSFFSNLTSRWKHRVQSEKEGEREREIR